MKLLSAIYFAVAAATTAFAADSRYSGDQVVRFNVTSPKDADILKDAIDKGGLGLDVWTHRASAAGKIDVRVPFSSIRAIKKLGLPYTVLVPDLQALVDAERDHMGKNSEVLHNSLMSGEPVQLTAATIFNDWQSYETLSAFIAGLPGVTQLPSIGKTYQGRDINAFKFGTGPYAVVFNGGIHAREWISPATTTYVTDQLVKNADLLKKFTFYVIPVLNPDGYAYTRAASGQRYHRKNLEPNAGTSCIGTDINRNFDYMWSKPGASSDQCSDTYYGKAALSTAEASSLSKFIKSIPNTVGYVDLHSYSEMFLFANGYTCTGQVKDYDTLYKGSKLAADAIKATSGEIFKYGGSCATSYKTSGDTVDYMYNAVGVTYSYTLELRPNENAASGTAGFNPPVSEIIPSGQETTAAFLALWNYVYGQLSATPSPSTSPLPPTSISKTSAPTSKTATPATTSAAVCSHTVCVTGGKLVSSCSDCAKAVCAKDSYCCNTSWDSTCVREVSQYCTGVAC
ncbi:Carboxypeptidase A4 [Chytriomyces hyalinus]|nr:Carboxypeptidase A4 [Chytriomyces hyalinus]